MTFVTQYKFVTLYNVTNKQTNKHKHTHSPFTTLSVTIQFTLLMSDTFHDFPFSVDICHNLPNKNNNKKSQSGT